MHATEYEGAVSPPPAGALCQIKRLPSECPVTTSCRDASSLAHVTGDTALLEERALMQRKHGEEVGEDLGLGRGGV